MSQKTNDGENCQRRFSFDSGEKPNEEIVKQGDYSKTKKDSKKVEKRLKKVLTKREEFGIIYKLLRAAEKNGRANGARTLKTIQSVKERSARRNSTVDSGNEFSALGYGK